jgi:hypothetical protein
MPPLLCERWGTRERKSMLKCRLAENAPFLAEFGYRSDIYENGFALDGFLVLSSLGARSFWDQPTIQIATGSVGEGFTAL